MSHRAWLIDDCGLPECLLDPFKSIPTMAGLGVKLMNVAVRFLFDEGNLLFVFISSDANAKLVRDNYDVLLEIYPDLK